MNKQEFVTGLRQNLYGIDDYEFVNETVSYYEDYIETRMRKGESESTILAELGEPRLIAKSIKASKSEIVKTEEKTIDTEGDIKMPIGAKLLASFMKMTPGIRKLIAIASGIAILCILVLIIQWMFPVIVVGAVALILYRFFKNNF